MKDKHILDPLWITKGTDGFDSEYYKYIILSANQKWRNLLKEEDYSSFYEILFHSLNLNNLAVEGSMVDFKLNPVWDNPKFVEIRKHLRDIYDLPEELVEIFKNTNYTLTKLMVDYLEKMLGSIGSVRIHFVNPMIHIEKEVYMLFNNTNNPQVSDIWKLRCDRRLKYGHTITRIGELVTDDLEDETTILKAIEDNGNEEMDKIDPDDNLIVITYDERKSNRTIAHAIAYSLIFSKGIVRAEDFQPNILEELHDILATEWVMPFTIKSWK